MDSRTCPCDSYINIVAGTTHAATDATTLKRAHRTVEGDSGAMFCVSLMTAKPLRDENNRPKKNDRDVYQPGEHGPQRRTNESERTGFYRSV